MEHFELDIVNGIITFNCRFVAESVLDDLVNKIQDTKLVFNWFIEIPSYSSVLRFSSGKITKSAFDFEITDAHVEMVNNIQ